MQEEEDEEDEEEGDQEPEGRDNQPMNHEENTSSHRTNRANDLLRQFNPKDLVQKASTKERIQTFLLRVKAVIPLVVSLFMIYLITFVYLFTYWVPLVFEDFNKSTNFFFEDTDDLPGLRKAPHPIRVALMGIIIYLFIIINISFFRAAFTPAGSLPVDHEWDIKDETLNLFKHKNQLSEDILDIDVECVSYFHLQLSI